MITVKAIGERVVLAISVEAAASNLKSENSDEMAERLIMWGYPATR
jgi:DNA-binding IclR family transcriptional regulator